MVVVVGGGVVVVVVVEQPHEPWVGGDPCTSAGVDELVALQAAPPNVTLKAIITIADPMATMVRFTALPSCCLFGHPVAPLDPERPPVGCRRFRECCLLDRQALPLPERCPLDGGARRHRIRGRFDTESLEPAT